MSREEDRTLFADIFEPFDRAIKKDSKSHAYPVIQKLFTVEASDNDKTKQSTSFSDTSKSTPKRKRVDSGPGASSPAAAVAASPWETRRLKGDLIEAKAQIARLELLLDQQRRINKETAVMFESEKGCLVDQQMRDLESITQLEEHLKFVRERESDVKEKLSELTHQSQKKLLEADKKFQQILRENTALKQKILEMNANNKEQISEMRKDMDELSQALESTQKEAEYLRQQLSKQRATTTDVVNLQVKLDTTKMELTTVKSRVKELEFEREAYKDSLAQAKTFQNRLAEMPELEKQLERMKKEQSHLRSLAQGKLLMEEKMNNLMQRVASLEPAEKELRELMVKYATSEAALDEWQEVLHFVMPPTAGQCEKDEEERRKTMRGGTGARLVKSALERAQQTELLATNERLEANSQVLNMKNEMSTMKHELEKGKHKLEDLEKLQNGQKSLLHRLQKRLALVARERDSYRNQLDCYEKELTVTISGEGTSGNPLQMRVDELEHTLQGYRDLLDKMEKENVTTADVEAPSSLRDQLARLHDQVKILKSDNDLLRTSKDKLEMQLEYRAMKGDYDPTKYKILHITNNPATVAQALAQTDLEKAEAEIKRLRHKIQKLEADGADMSQRLSESIVGGGSNSKDVQKLKQELEGSKIRLQRMKEVFTSSSKEFRDVCYLLLGYKIDKVGPQYKLTSMYADSPEEYLNFTLTDGEIEMVQTNYSMTIGDLMEVHLHQHRSLPLFLSALTMELFSKTTMMEEEEDE